MDEFCLRSFMSVPASNSFLQTAIVRTEKWILIMVHGPVWRLENAPQSDIANLP